MFSGSSAVNFHRSALDKVSCRRYVITKANSQIQIDRYSSIGPKASIAYLNDDNKFEGWKTIFSKSGASVQYNTVDFGKEPVQEVKIRVKSASGGTLQVKAGDKKNVIATIKVPRCKEWTVVSAPVKNAPEGIQNLYVTLKNGSMEVDWLGFDGTPWSKGAFETKKYRNLFAEYGYKQADIDAKLKEIFDGLFVRKRRRT